MALDAVVQSLDDLPEALQSHYAKVGDNFILQIGGVNDHPDVKNLKTAHEAVKQARDKLRTENAELKAKVGNLPEDFTPEAWASMKSELETLKAGEGGDVAKKVEAATAALKTQHQQALDAAARKLAAETKTRDDKVVKLEGEISRILVDGVLTKELTAVGVAPHFLDAVKAVIAPTVEVVTDEDSGVHETKMRAELGGEDVAKYLATWAASDRGKVFVTPAKGGGADNGKGGGHRETAANPFAKGTWNKTEQGALLTSDRGKAERLAKSAGFKTLDHAVRSTAALDVQ